jgi:PAS domain S-box-containing protein
MKQKIQVLVAADSDALLRTIEAALRQWDDQIILKEAGACSEALNYAGRGGCNCIVFDGDSPSCDPFKIIAAFARSANPVPVIMLSSSEDILYAVRAVRSGAYDYIPLRALGSGESSRMLYDSIMSSVSRSEVKAEKRKKQRALQLSEERYRGLIEHSPILILRFFADDGIVNFVNDGFCKYFDLERAQVVGEDLSVFLPRAARDELSEKIRHLTADNRVTSLEMGLSRDGKPLWQQWTVQGFFDDRGRPIEYQCIGEDITSLKVTNENLKKALDELHALKNMQDGDYYLTSLILDPLGRNNASSDAVSIAFFVKQYKEFSFKKWSSALGGDLCYSHNIYLNDKIYIVFLNADAMGKSMQGAGGALVLGAIFQSIIDRSRFSSDEQSLYPEQWLKKSFTELHRVFEVFNGAMLISLVMGLVEEDTGLMYFVNAEHPWSVLYRGGRASFIEGGKTLRKIGTQGTAAPFAVQTLQLEKGDVIIAGSDGRDELMIRDGPGGALEMNRDEGLFLAMVQDGRGDLEFMYRLISARGEIRDDVSLIRIEYAPPPGVSETKELLELIGAYEGLDEAARLTRGEDVLKEALARFGDSPPVLRLLFRLLSHTGDTVGAWKAARRLVIADSSSREDILDASVAAMQAGELREAEKLAERLCIRAPENMTYLAHYTHLLVSNEKYSMPMR